MVRKKNFLISTSIIIVDLGLTLFAKNVVLKKLKNGDLITRSILLSRKESITLKEGMGLMLIFMNFF